MSSDHSLTLFYLSLPNKQTKKSCKSHFATLPSHLQYEIIGNLDSPEIQIFSDPVPRYKMLQKMGIEIRNYRHNSTEPKPLLHAYNIDNFKWAVCLAWTPEQTDKQNKQVGYYYCNTGGYELFGYQILRLNLQISAKNRSKPKKYGHFASIVIEINRSKLIILHRNLDVNESQGEFQENKSKQIILHHRSLCKIDGT